MSITLYRGDGRPPQQISTAGGFQARLQLDAAAVRAVIIRAAIDELQDVTGLTGNRVSQIVDYLLHNPGLTGLGPLYQQVKKEREANSIHISTETTVEGGGMGGAYLYEIQCPTPLYEWSPTRGGAMTGIGSPPTPINTNTDLTASSIRSFLLTDANDGDDARRSVEASDVIALYNPGQTVREVAFLTPVPYAWIVRYRQGSGPWVAMP